MKGIMMTARNTRVLKVYMHLDYFPVLSGPIRLNLVSDFLIFLIVFVIFLFFL